MSQELRRVAKDGSIYAIANIVGRLSGVILIPVYAYALSLEDYALYVILVAVLDLASLVFGFGLNAAMARFYFEEPDNADMQARVVSTVFLGFIMSGIFLIGLAWLVSGSVGPRIFGAEAPLSLFAFAISSVVMTIGFEIVSGYYLIRKRPMPFLALSVGKSLLLLASNLILVVWLGFGVPGIVYAMLGSFLLLTVPSTAAILLRTGLHFDGRIMRGLLAYGLPLIPSAAANAVMRVIERQMLAGVSMAAVALYGLADRLAALLQMFVAAPFSQIFFVRRFETLSRGESQSELERILLIFVALMAVAALGLSAFGTEIVLIVAPDRFFGLLPLLPWLGLAYVMSALTVNIELGILYRKRTHIIPVIGIGALALFAAVAAIMIPAFGAQGAAMTMAGVSICRLATTVWANDKWGTATVSTSWPRTIAIIMLSFLTGIALTETAVAAAGIGELLIRAIVWVGFVVALFYSPLLDRQTRHDLLRLTRLRRDTDSENVQP